MKPMTAGEFIKMAMDKPDGDNIIEGILPQGEVMIICGDPYKGKSLEGQRLACQFVTGGSYHGLQIKKCESLYLTWEGSEKGIAGRFAMFVKDIPEKKHPLIQRMNEPMPLNTEHGYNDFLQVINDAKEIRDIKVVIVDSFSYTVEGDYKTDVVVNKWWTAVQKLSKETGVTFIFIWEFTKPIIFRGEEQAPDLSRLKSAYTTAYKVNTVVCMGEKEEVKYNPTTKKSTRTKSPQIVVMKAKDCGKLPPLDVELKKETLCYDGNTWKLNPITSEYEVVESTEGGK